MFGWFAKKAPPPSAGPDFSAIDSREKAEELARRGQLEAIYLIPPAFGGIEAAANTVYVPVGLSAVKESTDRIVAELVESGKVTRYKAMPQYQGKSFIPTAIDIEAFDPSQFRSTIKIWGEALT